jgi:hypothetical protein
MNFKQAVESDVTAVFTNPNEMGEVYNINGNKITGVLTQDTFEKRSNRSSSDYAEGISVQGAYFTCASSYFKRDPVRDEVWTVDGIKYTVTNVEKKMGAHSVTLIRNVGR